ncbi:MAG: hypothetical protein HC822_13210 [Oscillochloris sp.]|nr:hypothetical protein [Oscillochloris sp.]
MKIVHRAYLELPASIDLVRKLLRDPARWPQHIAGAERLGVFWRYGADLYALQYDAAHDADDSFGWIATPATGIGAHLIVQLQLSDAVISTHLNLNVTLDLPVAPWPWRVWRLRTDLDAAIKAIYQALIAPLRIQPRPVAVSLAAVSVLDNDDPIAADLPLIDTLPDSAHALESLRERYPRTIDHFLAMDARDHLERVVSLEQNWEQMLHSDAAPQVHATAVLPPAPLDADLIYAGGGLGLIHATVMAVRYGYRVLLFDRGEVGCAHREWNISRDELQALVDLGVVDWPELAPVIMREYRSGVLRFFNRAAPGAASGEMRLPEVLNLALDASGLLRLMRRKFEAAGGRVLNRRQFRRVVAAVSVPQQIEVELEDLVGGVIERFRARLLLDGMGSTSPLALQRHSGRPFAGVCPTVGTVAAGFAAGQASDEYDPDLGDILISIADTQRGEQLMWEGFPGRNDEMTVYLFYYATIEAGKPGNPLAGLHPAALPYSLLDLFEQYFTLLPTYKRPGPDFRHLRPVYGYIPARHSLHSHQKPLLRGVLPVGDSAAQQSPLTFCGFGSHIRNLGRTTGLLDEALRQSLLEPDMLALINAFQTNVSLHWVFSRFMHAWSGADDVNRLLNIFLDVLQARGVGISTRFFRDQMRWSDYPALLQGILRRYPQILAVALRVIGLHGVMSWWLNFLRFNLVAIQAGIARLAGPNVERLLYAAFGRMQPRLGLRLRARYAEWRVMGWL